MTVLGIRLNNWPNIRATDPITPWEGLADPPAVEGYCHYVAPVWGVRAGAECFVNYGRLHAVRVPSLMISRWAPAADRNNVAGYVEHVREWTGFDMAQPLDLTDSGRLNTWMRAIVRQEVGLIGLDVDQVIADGCARALAALGLAPSMPSIAGSPWGASAR